ncbi:MAG TPA: HEAT repeat domain-containing protein [Gemmatimonadales bacterium]|nr:HEAT repeat domain-containing protein [Gemmatimonadales bacterium]
MPAFPVPGTHLMMTAALLSALAMAADAQVPPAAPVPPAAYAHYVAPAPRAVRPATPMATRLPAEATIQGDPADSLYRSARSAMQRGRFHEAAEMMRDLRKRYPKSGYVADSYYWEAYSLSRVGGSAELRQAMAALETQESRYPKAATRGDARTLRAELMARLARAGDANAAEDLTRAAMGAGAPVVAPAPAARPAPAPRPARPAAPVVARGRDSDECGEDDDVQAAALNGLMQMDASRAMPVLKKVLARRDPGSECLRRRAVFIVSQQATDAAPILLETARNDPDAGVRGQAVFWLSQVNSDAAVSALDSILRLSKDAGVREKAIYALGQQESPRAAQSLRDLASNEQAPAELREKAVFWIGQRDDAASRTYLRDLYRKTSNAELKEKILFSVSQSSDPQARPWLLGVVRDPKEPMEARKRALFWVGQQGATAAELSSLGNQITEPELREQMVFALAQSNDPAAIDRLIEIARSDKDREMRKKAIFWLGQSDDPRATDVLAKILTGEK